MRKKNNEVIEFLKEKEIQIVGFASIEENGQRIPEEFSPQALLNNVKTVICFGVPIPMGVIYSESNDNLLYWRYCNMMYRSIDATENSLCLFLENKGYVSTPIYSCYPWKIVKRDFWGLIPLVYWAEKAGIGRLTKSGLLGHPKYGTRILIGGVLTSMHLEPSPRIQAAICPMDCVECIESCNVKAIDTNGKVDHNLCIRNANTNPLMAHLLQDTELRKNIDFETIMNTIGVDDHSYYHCLECLKMCPLNKKRI
ncbi:MAG: epoxyqueuosine reductase [Candidatus Heimdallarchaeota archaeon]|nr:MAG: epoxyqueuosine reductase [Candidatus Heimdallarchaeota archaeon]